MIITKAALSRRTFLRGSGATLALPLLDAMTPALTAAGKERARRLGFVYLPMGADMPRWTPQGEGALGDLPPLLASLARHRSRMTVLTNTELKHATLPVNANHASANCTFLSCAPAKVTEGSDYYLATTVDQIAAQRIGKETALPSLELGLEVLAQVGGCDNGLSCAYQNCLSWSSPTMPLAPEGDPRVLFERLFGDGGSAAERSAELRRNKSILDSVLQQVARLQRELGPGDRGMVDQYLDSVREIERRIQKAEQQGQESALPALERPISVPASWDEHAKLMFDLLVLALQADMTRVFTFQLGREGSTRSYPQIGVSEAHHPLSHHGNSPEKILKLGKITAYHVSTFGYLLDKLETIRDGDGTLLDHALVMLGSGMSNSDAHDHRNLPVIVVGGGGGKHRGGRHIRYADQTPLANVHLTLLGMMGANVEKFGDSTGKINEMMA
jgi:hypothetical protein